uniref:uncharacterized protein LOC104266376 n=1 Tax=Ciona intestinalis TaxID=7719 RepID=UPI0005214C77|nr:uncharacterized protein LOC104266376 [Ciona intestinalis]|eukprot:XP_018670172.2 uncharacterized protein LOC104266376 [Ciona intestinalis]
MSFVNNYTDQQLSITLDGSKNYTRKQPQQGPAPLIAVISVIVALEMMVLLFVLKVSWDNEHGPKRNERHRILKFLKNLSPLKKSFLVSNFIIICDSSIFLVRLLVPITYDDMVCSLMLRVTGSTTYSTAMTSVYIYLWARQYYLHSSPVLRNVLPRWLPILSKLSLLLTVLAYVIPLIIIWGMAGIGGNYRNGECYHAKNSSAVFPIVMMATTIATQIFYVFLFYATLRLHKKANKSATGGNETLRTAFRCLCFAIVCVGTDCMAMVAIKLTASSLPEIYVHLFPKTDLLFNLLCMLFCFSTFTSTMKRAANILTCGHYQITDDSNQPQNRSSLKSVVVTSHMDDV